MGQMESNVYAIKKLIMKEMFKSFVLLITVFFFSKVAAQRDSLFISEIMPFQKEMIQRLAGEKPIKDAIYLAQRASPKERKLTVEFVSEHLKNMGWNLENHHYKATNGNPFLDLILAPATGINISAALPATVPSDEYVVFGGHYDSERESPGAIDNATGVTLCVTIASKLAALKERNKNFIIVLFDQEEDNEVGSKAYAKMLQKSKRKVHSVHTIDMMGWDEDHNRGFELELPSPYLEKLYKTEAQKFNIPLYTAKVSSSDHKSFIDRGFTTIGISEEYVKRDTTPYIHTPKDTYSTVNFDFLASSTQFIFHVFKTLVQ